MTTNNNSDNNEKKNETTFNPGDYNFLKKKEMASLTAGMAPEQKSKFQKDSLESFVKLCNAFGSNDLQTIDSLMKKSSLTPLDFKMAQYLATQHSNAHVAAIIYF
jgi:hypothetical protein